jgi:hypothetical protein
LEIAFPVFVLKISHRTSISANHEKRIHHQERGCLSKSTEHEQCFDTLDRTPLFS